MLTKTNTSKYNFKIFGDKKWAYLEGFSIVLGLLIFGFLTEGLNKEQSLPILLFPNNIFLGLGFISILVTTHIFFKKSRYIKFLRSTPAAVSAILFFAINALLMGVFMQNPKLQDWTSVWSLNQVTSSYYFLFSNLYLLITLGFLILYKLETLSFKSLGILVSHFGLWLVIFAGSMGSFEISRLEMRLSEDNMTFHAKENKTGLLFEMPFAFKLIDFLLEEYPPKIGIVDNSSGKLLHEQGKNIRILEDSSTFEVINWRVEILEYLETAGKAGSKYYFLSEIGAAPAARIQAISNSGDTTVGWISCGSFNSQYESLKLDDNHSMIMLFPEPKNYISKLELHTPEGKQDEFNLEVNHPYSWKGWEIYQISYDDEFGKWSDTSVIELVRDPWLPAVYTGIFLMLFGAVYLFWFGTIHDKK